MKTDLYNIILTKAASNVSKGLIFVVTLQHQGSGRMWKEKKDKLKLNGNKSLRWLCKIKIYKIKQKTIINIIMLSEKIKGNWDK